MKDTIKSIAQKKLMWGIIIMVTCQIQGVLPLADFISPLFLKILSFVIGIFLTGFKGVEMYFEKSQQLEETTSTDYISRDPNTGIVEKGNRQTTTVTPVITADDGTAKS